eukprot:gene4724-6821_t
MSNQTYEPSALVRSFHKTPHYDLAFRPISHTFQPEVESYQQALAQLAWPFPVATIAVVSFTFKSTRRIIALTYSRYWKGNVRFTEPPDLTRSRLIQYLLCIAIGSALVICFKANADLTSGAGSLRQRTRNSASILDDISNASLTAGNASNILSSVVKQTNWSSYNHFVQQQAEGLESELIEYGKLLFTIGNTAKSYDPVSLNEDVRRVDKLRSSLTIAFTTLILFVVFAAVCAVAFNHRFAMEVCCVLGYVSFFIVGLLAGAELALSVGIADFCYEPAKYIITQSGSPVSAYYLVCNTSMVPSPYEPKFQQASQALYLGQEYIQQIEQNTSETFDQITTGINTLEVELSRLKGILACDQLHSQLIAGINIACGNGFHGSAAFLFIFVLLLLGYIISNIDKDKAFYISSSIGENSPLVWTNKSYFMS